jgi:hypothetical protein
MKITDAVPTVATLLMVPLRPFSPSTARRSQVWDACLGVAVVLVLCSCGSEGATQSPLLTFSGPVPEYTLTETLSVTIAAETSSGPVTLANGTLQPAGAGRLSDVTAGGWIDGELTPLADIPDDVFVNGVNNAGGPPLCDPPIMTPPSLSMASIQYQFEAQDGEGNVVGVLLYGRTKNLDVYDPESEDFFSVGDLLSGFLLAQEAGRAEGSCQVTCGPDNDDCRNGYIQYDLDVVEGWNHITGEVLELLQTGDIGRLRVTAGAVAEPKWYWVLLGHGGGPVGDDPPPFDEEPEEEEQPSEGPEDDAPEQEDPDEGDLGDL